MVIKYNDIRVVMLSYLRRHPRGQFNLQGGSIQHFYETDGFSLDETDLENL